MIFTEREKQVLRNGELVYLRQDEVDCVVVRADVFQRLTGRFDEGLSSQEVSKLVDQIMSDDDASDPLLESYQCYRQ